MMSRSSWQIASAWFVLFAACGPVAEPPSLPPPSSGAPAVIDVRIDGLQPGDRLSTSRIISHAAPDEQTLLSDGSPVILQGASDNVFLATVESPQGQLLQTYSMAAQCSLSSSRQRRVPQDYSTIQAAVLAASPGDTVKVAPGTYTEFIRLRRNVCLLGSGADRTILDAGGAAENLIELTDAPGSAVIGFTLRGVAPRQDSCGQRGDPFACAGYYTAAIYMESSKWDDPVRDFPPLIANNLFVANEIGVLLYWGSAIFMRNNIFTDNRYGLIANHFQSNGPVLNIGSIANNVFAYNRDIAIGNQAAYLNIVNNVIAYSKEAIYFEYIQTGTIACNLFYANTANQTDYPGAPPRFTIGVDGNIEADPGFLGSGDFHLSPTSPAIDHGCFSGRAFDADGSVEDIGAYGGPLGSWSIR